MSKAETAIRGYEHLVRVDDRGVEQYLELPRELRSIYARSALYIKLTDSCTCACAFCINAKKGPVSQCISQSGVLDVIDDAIALSRGQEMNRASMPSDVFYDDTDVGDWLRICGDAHALYELVSRSAWNGRFVGISTAIPPHTEALFAEALVCMQEGGVFASDNVSVRVSRGRQNTQRIETFIDRYQALGGEMRNLRIEQRSADNLVKPGAELDPMRDNPLHAIGIHPRDVLVIQPGGLYTKFYAANTAYFNGGQALFPLADPLNDAAPLPFPQSRFDRQGRSGTTDAGVWRGGVPVAVEDCIGRENAGILNAGRYLIAILDDLCLHVKGKGITMQTPNDVFWQTATPQLRQHWTRDELRNMRAQIAGHLEHTEKDPVLSAYLEQFLKV